MSISYQIILMDMTVNEVVTENEDGSYTIFINSRLNHEKRLKSYLHAMNHIKGMTFKKMTCRVLNIWHMFNVLW